MIVVTHNGITGIPRNSVADGLVLSGVKKEA